MEEPSTESTPADAKAMEEESKEYISGFKLISVVASVALVVFLLLLDQHVHPQHTYTDSQNEEHRWLMIDHPSLLRQCLKSRATSILYPTWAFIYTGVYRLAR